MSAMDYRIALLAAGSNPANWDLVQTVLGRASIPVGITSEYVEDPEIIKVADASRLGRGMGYFTWAMEGVRLSQYVTLRTYCPGVSATVYARTMTHELQLVGNEYEPVWNDVKAEMVWPERVQFSLTGFINFLLHFDIIEEV